MGSMGRKGKKRTAPKTENMLPKLLLIPIMTYFMVLPKVARPAATPSESCSKLLWVRMRSADSLATSTALLTEIPTSADWSEGASLMPSPI